MQHIHGEDNICSTFGEGNQRCQTAHHGSMVERARSGSVEALWSNIPFSSLEPLKKAIFRHTFQSFWCRFVRGRETALFTHPAF
eukprot:scaffold9951_cov146-Cylindrotheca_fusiformis.AAC.11